MPSSSPFTRKGRTLLPGQRSELTLIDAGGSGRQVILTADEIIEAPNWTPDGTALIFNAGGEIWRIGIDGTGLTRIETGTIRDLNNDHVLSPDGTTIYLSNQKDGALYAVGIEGGEPRLVSNAHIAPFHYYLHGVSPDGTTLSYVAVEGPAGAKRINIFTILAAGGPDTRLTDVSYPNDGPEYSPDGQWLYFNAERAAKEPGHAQCFRMKPDGAGIEQLSFDQRVNWFPHLSPDGQSVVYISFPPGTLGHPPDKDVILRFMRPDGSGQRDIVSLFGGQGTINVNSWAPDSRRFAYVAYPVG
ncbi:MAG: biopolymer transporter Tol [Devosia sp.]|nr:biopolymer transporter Tol [Devosia sp.]